MSIHIPFSQRKRFWVNFIQALNATPLETNKFLGATGIEHPVLRAGLDNKKQRLILISADNSPRITALAQSDIQAAYPTLQVLAVQPVIISHEDLTNPKKDLETILEEVRQGAQLCISELEPTTPNEYLKEALAITANMYFKDITSYMDTPSMGLYLKEAAKINQEEAARKLGICPLPIYNFSIEQLELVIDDSQPNKTKEILHYHNIIQYFFPPPDQVALGLIEQTQDNKIQLNESQLEQQLRIVPQLGHPYSKPEIVDPSLSLPELIAALHQKGLTVSGEFGLEITPTGKAIRQEIRFQPREGLIMKLISRLKISLSLKDFLERF